MHPFDCGTLTLGRLAVGFYTLILFIIKWHNVRLPFRPSVSSCHAVNLVLFVNNLPDVDIQLNTWLDLRQVRAV